MAYETLKVTKDERGVVDLCLNRPDARNAISGQMIAELTSFAETTGHDPATRAIVMRGAGDFFCAGADLRWMQMQIKADRETRKSEARKLAMALKALNEMRAPLIGKLHGGAFGGGVGLACICDVVVADAKTKFGLTETKLGLTPATISPYVVARMGEGMARRVFMSARLFDVREAQTLGIVARVTETDTMDAAVEAEVSPYLSAAPGAVADSKALARLLGPKIDEATIDRTIDQLAKTWDGEEAAAGIAAFFDKTKPPWV